MNRQEQLSSFYAFTFIVLVAVVGTLYLRRQVPYAPIEGIRLRCFNPATDWHQIWRWLKQKRVQQQWGEPRQALETILQAPASPAREERMIQVKRGLEWIDAGFLLCHMQSEHNPDRATPEPIILAGDLCLFSPDVDTFIRQLWDKELA